MIGERKKTMQKYFKIFKLTETNELIDIGYGNHATEQIATDFVRALDPKNTYIVLPIFTA